MNSPLRTRPMTAWKPSSPAPCSASPPTVWFCTSSDGVLVTHARQVINVNFIEGLTHPRPVQQQEDKVDMNKVSSAMF